MQAAVVGADLASARFLEQNLCLRSQDTSEQQHDDNHNNSEQQHDDNRNFSKIALRKPSDPEQKNQNDFGFENPQLKITGEKN